MVTARYGGPHRAVRRRYAEMLPLPCVFCGRVIGPGEPFDLDHQPGTPHYRGVACPRCNRRDGGIRGNKSPKRRNRNMDLQLRGMCAGLDLARDRTRTAVVLAGYADHPEAGEVIAARLYTFPGVATPSAVTAVWGTTAPGLLVVNGTGHLRVLSEPLKASATLHEATTQDMADANGRLLDSLATGRLRLPDPTPELNEAVQHARIRPLADGSAVDKKGAERDLSPLVALELAVWAVLRGVTSPFFASWR